MFEVNDVIVNKKTGEIFIVDSIGKMYDNGRTVYNVSEFYLSVDKNEQIKSFILTEDVAEEFSVYSAAKDILKWQSVVCEEKCYDMPEKMEDELKYRIYADFPSKRDAVKSHFNLEETCDIRMHLSLASYMSVIVFICVVVAVVCSVNQEGSSAFSWDIWIIILTPISIIAFDVISAKKDCDKETRRKEEVKERLHRIEVQNV